MKIIRRYGSLIALAACIAAALVFKQFTFVAWYPVLMSVAVGCGFLLSVLGRESLCLTFARKIPPHILPEGVESYCRKCTIVWGVWLLLNGGIATGTIFASGSTCTLLRTGIEIPLAWVIWNGCLSYCFMGLLALGEYVVRRRRFAVVFHTSGSSSQPKKIVKPFAMLAKEVAYHSRQLDCLQNLSNNRPLFLSTIEPHHMYGMLWRVLLPRAAGCTIDPEVILTPESLLEKMKTAPKVFLVTTPSFLDRFCSYADQYEVPQNCVEITTSGALLTAEVSAATQRVFGCTPLEIFGSTETGGVAYRRQTTPNEDEHAGDWIVFDPVKVKCDTAGRLVVNSPFSFQKNFVMGDKVELAPNGRTFKLLGRTDRLVKIAEQRVSLPEMEQKIKALPEVRESALVKLEGPHGPSLGMVAVLNLNVVDFSKGKKAIALDLRRKLLPIFPKGTTPRRYRFVAEMPRNAQGKIPSTTLRKICESNFLEPFVLDAKWTDSSWTAELVFDADAPYFQGHFPEFSVLPGVVQLGMAHHFAEMFRRRPLTLKNVRRMKFTCVVLPCERVQLTLVQKLENEISYEYRKGDRVCSSGLMCF